MTETPQDQFQRAREERLARKKPRNPFFDSAESRLMSGFGTALERASWTQCRYLGMWLGLAFHGALRKRREIATTNVRLAFPDLSEAASTRIARRSACNFAMTFCEFLHLRAATPREVRDYCNIDHPERIVDALSQNRGALLLTAHLGNWEVMGARAAQDFSLSVVARPAGNGAVQRHIDAVRESANIGVISKYDTGRSALKTLRANGTLGVLPDQYAWPDGAMLPMFGHPTRVVTSLARLALLSGAPILPSFGVRRTPWLRDGRIVATVGPHFSIEKSVASTRDETVLDGTRRVVAELEKIIRAHPEQWLWMHRRWREEDLSKV